MGGKSVILLRRVLFMQAALQVLYGELVGILLCLNLLRMLLLNAFQPVFVCRDIATSHARMIARLSLVYVLEISKPLLELLFILGFHFRLEVVELFSHSLELDSLLIQLAKQPLDFVKKGALLRLQLGIV